MKRFLTLFLTIILLACCSCFVACNEHTHNFNQKVMTSTYRKTIASCGHGAVYYYSCTCGEKGTETFDAGGPLGHSYVNRECIRCHAISPYSEGLLYKSLSDDTCFVYNLGICEDKDIVIPSVYEGKTVMGINNEVFKSYSNLESIKIPSTVSSIGKYAFSGCVNLKSVIFEQDSQLVSIGEGAFENCSKLRDITLPNQVGVIYKSAFSYCMSLEEITIPSSTLIIDTSAFNHCINLKNLVISNGVKNIGDGAFEYCDELQTVTIPNSVTEFGTGVFASCNNLMEIIVESENQSLKAIDGNLYNSDGKTLLQYAMGKTANSFIVPNNVEKIGEKAFSSSKSLISITLPQSLKTIDNDAFEKCDNLFEVYNLSTLNIQKGSNNYGSVGYKARDIYISLDSISKLNLQDGYIIYTENNAILSYIGSQNTIVIPEGITKIAEGSFEYNLDLQTLTISNSVTSIGSFAFAYCSNLATITIGSNITNIDMGAFLGCAKLTNINYLGTMLEWESVIKGTSWDFSTGKFTINCSDGIIQK